MGFPASLPLFVLPLLFLSSVAGRNVVYNKLVISGSTAAADSKLGVESSAAVSTNAGDVLELELVHRTTLGGGGGGGDEAMQETLARDERRVDWIHRRLHQRHSSTPSKKKPGAGVAAPAPGNGGGGASAPSSMTTPVTSGLALGSGEYFVRITVGTPAQASYMVLDTGSDLPWLQCSPCKRCYRQADPVFDPRNSSTFSPLACSHPQCRSLGIHGCGNAGKRCIYQVSYGDGSFTMGDLGSDTFTLGGTTGGRSSVPGVAFGCGYDNEGLFVGAGGLLGLGGGKLSFVSQIGGKRFAYCLADRSKTASKAGTLAFGAAAMPPPGVGTSYTPLLRSARMDTFYYAALVGVSVGGTSLPLPRSAFGGGSTTASGSGGGIIIDSGTSVTRLPTAAYSLVRAAFKDAASTLQTAPKYSLFDTCFNFSKFSSVDVPALDLLFDGGAQMKMPASNYMVAVDKAGTYCLALAPTSTGLAILGNIQQQGFKVGFDLQASKISLTPQQCS